MSDLHKFLTDIDLCTQFQYPNEEITDIKNAVEEMVQRITEECCLMDEKFKVGNILKVGSFYENTKIMSPNEFDYLAELTDLSGQEQISIKPDWTGGFHVCLDADHIEKWKGSEVNGNISVEGFLRPQAVQMKFSNVLQKAIGLITQRSDKNIIKNSGKLQLLKEVRGGFPNTAIFMQWCELNEEDILIGTDITPFIVCPDFLLQNLKSWVNFNDLNENDRPVLVPPSLTNNKSCRVGKGVESCCWRISYTPVEVTFMQALKPNHRTCYRILKYLCKREGGVDPFSSESLKTLSSYHLKMVILSHNSACNMDGNDKIPSCFGKTFDSLISSVANAWLPSHFDLSKNTWARNSQSRQLLVPDKIVSMLTMLLFEKLGKHNSKEYSFEQINKMLRKLQRKFLDIEINRMNVFPDSELNMSDAQLALEDKDYDSEPEGTILYSL